MTLSHADMVKIEKNYRRGNPLPMPRYDKPLRKLGTRIKDGDRSLREGATVQFREGYQYGKRCVIPVTGRTITAQVWSRAPERGQWYVVSESQDAYRVRESDMMVIQGAGEQMALDTSSSASVQHYIETGEYLPVGEAEPYGVAGVSGDSSL